MAESRKITLEIVEILRKCSSKDVAEEVFGEISKIWHQNIVDDIDDDDNDDDDYDSEIDLHLK